MTICKSATTRKETTRHEYSLKYLFSFNKILPLVFHPIVVITRVKRLVIHAVISRYSCSANHSVRTGKDRLLLRREHHVLVKTLLGVIEEGHPLVMRSKLASAGDHHGNQRHRGRRHDSLGMLGRTGEEDFVVQRSWYHGSWSRNRDGVQRSLLLYPNGVGTVLDRHRRAHLHRGRRGVWIPHVPPRKFRHCHFRQCGRSA